MPQVEGHQYYILLIAKHDKNHAPFVHLLGQVRKVHIITGNNKNREQQALLPAICTYLISAVT